MIDFDQPEQPDVETPEAELEQPQEQESQEVQAESAESKSKSGLPRLKRQLHEATTELQQTRAYMAEMQRQLEEVKQRLAPPQDDNGPSLDQFDSYDAYQAAERAWTGKKIEEITDRKAREQFERLLAEKESEERQKEAKKKLADMQEKGIEKYPDFMEVITSVPGNPYVASALIELESVADVAYYIAKNPDLLEKMNGWTPAKIAIELGKIELNLSKQTNKRSALPAPIRPGRSDQAPAVKGSGKYVDL